MANIGYSEEKLETLLQSCLYKNYRVEEIKFCNTGLKTVEVKFKKNEVR